MVVTDVDRQHLQRCVDLARTALEQGHGPFGAVLAGADGRALHEDHNRVTDVDQTYHAETGVIRWAVSNMAPVQRIRTVLYSSCEPCPMCAATHAWAGLGRIVYATSNAQLTQWLTEWRASAAPVAMLPVEMVVPRAVVTGPVTGFAQEMRTLYEKRYRR